MSSLATTAKVKKPFAPTNSSLLPPTKTRSHMVLLEVLLAGLTKKANLLLRGKKLEP